MKVSSITSTFDLAFDSVFHQEVCQLGAEFLLFRGGRYFGGWVGGRRSPFLPHPLLPVIIVLIYTRNATFLHYSHDKQIPTYN